MDLVHLWNSLACYECCYEHCYVLIYLSHDQTYNSPVVATRLYIGWDFLVWTASRGCCHDSHELRQRQAGLVTSGCHLERPLSCQPKRLKGEAPMSAKLSGTGDNRAILDFTIVRSRRV